MTTPDLIKINQLISALAALYMAPAILICDD